MTRATLLGEEYHYRVRLDGYLIVGVGTRKECQNLVDELCASDMKCNRLKKIMED